MKKLLIIFAAFALITACGTNTEKSVNKFIKVENGQFIREGEPYRYVGANMWYGGMLGSEGANGDRERLLRELDKLKSLGVDNLRILVGSDGEHGVNKKVEPTLQIAPGVYNDTIMAGLDYLLVEMAKRDMVAVLYLNNSWEWSGGYGQYLEWAGYGTPPDAVFDGWEAYINHAKLFLESDKAKELFANYVKDMLGRTNRYTGVKYVDDPTIMSWQIGNEPRAFSQETKELFAEWMGDVSSLIRSLDPNHMISTGSEGIVGCEMDSTLFAKVHADKNIAYTNIHIWPYNWRWVTTEDMLTNIDVAKQKSEEYIQQHVDFAKKTGKPIVIEEFGYPRDNYEFPKTTPTVAKDLYYEFLLDAVSDNTKFEGMVAGCNFWAWGGEAKQNSTRIFWKPGDDYSGDPAQEQQGLYSVYTDDTTTKIIKEANSRIKEKLK